jgi:hypothetical protein
VWTHDDRLFVLSSPGSNGAVSDTVALLRVDPGGPNLLVQDKGFSLDVGQRGLLGTPVQLSNGLLTFVYVNDDPTAPSSRDVYMLALEDFLPHRIISLPAPDRENWQIGLVWSPDGTGALFTNGRGLWYVPYDGSAPYDLWPAINYRDFGQLTWVT